MRTHPTNKAVYLIPNVGLTMAETVKSRESIFSVSQSTFLRVLQKMTAWVMVRVSYRSHSVSSFHSWQTNTKHTSSTDTWFPTFYRQNIQKEFSLSTIEAIYLTPGWEDETYISFCYFVIFFCCDCLWHFLSGKKKIKIEIMLFSTKLAIT